MRFFRVFREELILISAVVVLLWTLTGLIDGKSWYGSDDRQLQIRLQTDAMLNGHLALSKTPFFHEQDWDWNDGLHQNWGLGASLLRIPFEFFCHALFDRGFPDRLLLFLFIIVAVLLLRKFCEQMGLSFLERLLIPLLCVFNPPVIRLLQSRFSVYEEVIFYGIIYAFVLFSLWRRLVDSQRHQLSSWVAASFGFLCGFGYMIRPTLLFFGGTLFLFSFISLMRRWRMRTLNLVLGFTVGIGLCLMGNKLRFGDFFEFGYSVNLSLVPPLDYLLRFENVYAKESLWRAMKEFFGTGFFLSSPVNASSFDLSPPGSFYSGAFRFREFTFVPFGPVSLLVFLVGWTLPFLRKGNGLRGVRSVGLASFCIFLLLVAFYVRLPALVCRYFLDFAAPLALAGIVAYFVLKDLVRLRVRVGGLVVLASCFWIPAFSHDKFGHESAGTWERVQKKMQGTQAILNAGLQFSVPPVQKCHDLKTIQFASKIAASNYSWDFRRTCEPSVVSTHFLPSTECVNLTIRIATHALDERVWDRFVAGSTEDVINEMLTWIRVKRGRDWLTLRSKNFTGENIDLKFCRSQIRKSDQIDLVTIAWVRGEDLMVKRIPFLLLELAASQEGVKE